MPERAYSPLSPVPGMALALLLAWCLAGVRTFRFVKRCVPNPQHLLKAPTGGRSLLRISGTLRLVGQLLYVIVTLLHTGGGGERPPPFSQCMPAVALDGQAGAARLANRFGAASTTAALALYGAVLAVDPVALKQAVTRGRMRPKRKRRRASRAPRR
jgi:hypothetical protein